MGAKSVKESVELKHLKTRLYKKQAECDEAKRVRDAARHDYNQIAADTNALSSEIKKIEEANKEKGVTVTEHALLRYAERLEGFDREAAIATILPESTRAKVQELGGNCTIKYDGHKLVIKNYTLVTVK